MAMQRGYRGQGLRRALLHPLIPAAAAPAPDDNHDDDSAARVDRIRSVANGCRQEDQDGMPLILRNRSAPTTGALASRSNSGHGDPRSGGRLAGRRVGGGYHVLETRGNTNSTGSTGPEVAWEDDTCPGLKGPEPLTEPRSESTLLGPRAKPPSIPTRSAAAAIEAMLTNVTTRVTRTLSEDRAIGLPSNPGIIPQASASRRNLKAHASSPFRGLLGVTNQLRSISARWHQEIGSSLGSALSNSVFTTGVASIPQQEQQNGQEAKDGQHEGEPSPETPAFGSQVKGRAHHRRGRSLSGNCAGAFGSRESFLELPRWLVGKEGPYLTGPVTGRPYSERMGDEYAMEGVIGRGQSGVVSRCRHRASGRAFACKTVFKAPLMAEDRLDELKREVRWEVEAGEWIRGKGMGGGDIWV